MSIFISATFSYSQIKMFCTNKINCLFDGDYPELMHIIYRVTFTLLSKAHTVNSYSTSYELDSLYHVTYNQQCGEETLSVEISYHFPLAGWRWWWYYCHYTYDENLNGGSSFRKWKMRKSIKFRKEKLLGSGRNKEGCGVLYKEYRSKMYSFIFYVRKRVEVLCQGTVYRKSRIYSWSISREKENEKAFFITSHSIRFVGA